MSEPATEFTLPKTGRLGIFWFFRGQLLACSVPLAQAERRGHRLDSPLAHVSAWPRLVAQQRKALPMLSVLEYDEVPRGRVLYDLLKQGFVIYMDDSLFTASAFGRRAHPPLAEALRTTFELHGHPVRFATDPHYRLLMSTPNDELP